MFFLSCAWGNGVFLGVHGEREVGKGHGHLTVLGKGRGQHGMVPEDKRIDGAGWEFMCKHGRGIDGGGRGDSICGRLLAMRNQAVVMQAGVENGGRIHRRGEGTSVEREREEGQRRDETERPSEISAYILPCPTTLAVYWERTLKDYRTTDGLSLIRQSLSGTAHSSQHTLLQGPFPVT